MTPRTATTEQLRRDIDSGLSGDKVDGGDPSAAPLGTDEEAAGTPVAPEKVAQARVAERRATLLPPGLPPGTARSPRPGWLFATIVACGAAAVLALLIFL